MKMKHILLSALMLIFAVGCENYLDIPKHGNMGGQDDFYKTDEEALQALASLYGTWDGIYSNWFYAKNLLSDDVFAGGGNRGDNTSMEQLNEYTFGTDNTVVKDLYAGMYALIYKANLIIEKVEPDTPGKARTVAEAKFFRAWANFDLVTLYGPVPKVDHLLAPGEYRMGNSTVEQLWEFIEQDLNEAIGSDALPSKSSANDAETGMRVTKEVAQAMLGKAYVFQEKYAEAAAILDQVIDSKKYELFKGDYDMLLHSANNNSCEAMLEIQKRKDPEQMSWAHYENNTMFYLMYGWRSDRLEMTGNIAKVIENGTWGFFNPRKSLYDAFVAMEGANGYRLSSTIRTADQMEALGVKVQPGQYLSGHEGYFIWKTRLLQEDNVSPGTQPWFVWTNYRVMRYAEVLLLAAEAHVLGGDKGKALDYINRIRERARLTPLPSVTLDDVKKEKRLELCLESVRFQDLVRWGDAESALAEQGKQIPAFTGSKVEFRWSNPTYGFKAKHHLLPIPRKEMELNPNMKQNEGWQ
ncbi:RagB/SusD family nutrient uptake outer membrane protein [uncultured Alistipes sp.]|uniref:RagB/SusD family nutrient uptake outer membrane protein n=2 Tax=uncultured Alistipes sp. TaxID=538949 RepID=UPI0025B793E0|nr:RagB/SusD family nutrient uptake outer membrane protein [uncultured Alistipes sp.]